MKLLVIIILKKNMVFGRKKTNFEGEGATEKRATELRGGMEGHREKGPQSYAEVWRGTEKRGHRVTQRYGGAQRKGPQSYAEVWRGTEFFSV
ncbi:MAG: hypothetical protein NW218_14755 [Saprospiraceae bacterium]|nr:hypothetical protein [Saprospiraceae bacterium]